MKKLVIFSVTALAAAVLTGTPSMTSQAAMCTYQISGGNSCSFGNQNCTSGGWNCNQNDCVIFDGTGSFDGGLLKPIKPLPGEILQGVNWNQPDEGNQKPDDGNQKPDDGNQKPDDGNQKPDDGNQKPDDGNQKPDDGNQKPGSEDAAAAQVLELVNAERAKAGAAALTLDSKATEAAQTRAQEIQRSFSHTRPNGSSFSTALTEAGVSYTASGENIAYGQNSAQAVMESWMNSSGHRANILNQNFTSIGIGHVQDSNGVDYWTQLFFR